MARIRITMMVVVVLACLCRSAVADDSSTTPDPSLPPDYPLRTQLPPAPDVPVLSADAIAKSQADPELKAAYQLATGTSTDQAQGYDRLLRLAANGDAVAETVAYELLWRRNADGDRPAAQTFLWRAAKSGYPPAALLSGIRYWGANPMMNQRAYQWFDVARQRGIPVAAIVLASVYQRGMAVTKDQEKAKKLIGPLLADDGALGLFARSVQYRRGIGVVIDLAKADEALHQAAEKGLFMAQRDYSLLREELQRQQPSQGQDWGTWWQRYLRSEMTWVMTWRPPSP